MVAEEGDGRLVRDPSAAPLTSGSGKHYTLKNGCIYDVGTRGDGVAETIEISGSGNVADPSPVAVTNDNGALAAICIPAGKTLILKGASASGMQCAGAGISIPYGTSLIVYGGGKLIVQGGNAAAGGPGGDGKRDIYCNWGLTDSDDKCRCKGGKGGQGGYGGGGGAAAIGGNGGRGAEGGSGGEGAEHTTLDSQRNYCHVNGSNGSVAPFSEATKGRDAGNLYLLGSLIVDAQRGTHAGIKPAKGGGIYESDGYPGIRSKNGRSYYFRAATGGGGGGGGSGWEALYAIGGGGPAGIGGGGGGGGGVCYAGNFCIGGEGKGGLGGTNGLDGAFGSGRKECKYKVPYGTTFKCDDGKEHATSAGGTGGVTQSHGAHGEGRRSSNVKLSASTTAVANYWRSTDWESHENLKFDFILKGVHGWPTENVTCFYGSIPDDLTHVPLYTDLAFCGYFRGDPDGGDGELWFDSAGQSVKKPFLFVRDTELTPYVKAIREEDLVGVRVNGRDLAYLNGLGWRYSERTHVLTLVGSGTGLPAVSGATYEIEGRNTNGLVRIVAEGHSSVTLKDLCIVSDAADSAFTSGDDRGLFSVRPNVRVELAVRGSNELARTGNGGCAFYCRGTLAVTNDLVFTGGKLVARGGGGYPAVGLAGGLLEMQGGRLFAFGGAGGAGVGGGSGVAAAGSVSVVGGTLYALGAGEDASDIGPGSAGGSLSVRITGGSVRCARAKISAAGGPTDGSHAPLWCIRTAVPDSPGDDYPVSITNLTSDAVAWNYGDNEMYPIQGRVYVWRPNGYHRYHVDGMQAWATVKDADTDALFAQTDVMVDGRNVGTVLGDGWTWSPATSNLVFKPWSQTLTVEGTDTNGMVHPVIPQNMSLLFNNLTLLGWGVKDGVVEVTGGRLSLKLSGANRFAGLEHYRGSGLAVGNGASLEISNADGTVGSLTVTGGVWGAGIGGIDGSPGPIVIRSGRVTAVGGFEGAGIGGASGFAGGELTIDAGANVNAVGGFGAEDTGNGAWTEGETADRKIVVPAAESGGSSAFVGELTDEALRGAIAYVSRAGGGTITFETNLVGNLELKRRLVLNAGAGDVTVKGEGRVRLVPAGRDYVPADGGGAILHAGSGTLTLSGLTFDGFSTTGCGGAVRAYGPLAVEDCTFANCSAGEYGGAVYTGPSATATFTGCRFARNVANGSGGAVFARWQVMAMRCGFDGNVAGFGGSAIGSFAIRTVAEHCSFLDNKAGERGAFDVPVGDAVAAACTFTRNEGEALHGGENLYAASTLSTGNATHLAPVSPADASTGLHAAEFVARKCAFGSVSAGAFADVITGLGANEPFAATTNAQLKVGSTVQIYRALTHRNKAIVQGCALWRTPGWEALSTASTTLSAGTKTPVYGHARPDVLCAVDQLGTTLADKRLLVGAVTASLESESLLVTTPEDVVDPDDDLTSLREAVKYAASDDLPARRDDCREITFAADLFDTAGNLDLSVSNGVLRVDGERIVAVNGGADGFALSLRSAKADDLFEVSSDSLLALENLTVRPGAGDTAVDVFGNLQARNVRFDGGGTGTAAVRGRADAVVWLERCTVVSNCATAVSLAGSATGHALGCTVAANDTTPSGGSVVDLAAGVSFDFANCTVAENRTPAGACAVRSAATNGTCLANCVLIGNLSGGAPLDFSSTTGTCAAAYSCFGKALGRLYDSWGTCSNGVTAAQAFDGGLRRAVRYGVGQCYYRQRRGGAIHNTGAFVFHSENWGDLAAGLYDTGSRRFAVRGDVTRAIWAEIDDIVNRTIVEGYISRGSYATCRDPEYFDDGVIDVNTTTDFPEPLPEHDYDGLVTLREAVDFACAHPEFRDRANGCTIRFADRFFAGRAANTVQLVRSQLDVTAGSFSNGTLRVCGRSDRQVTVSGAGRYRIFRTQADNAVELSSLTFENGLGADADWTHTSGGGLYNLGFTVVSNCVFRRCVSGWPGSGATTLAGFASGGAVYTAGGGNTVLERCTLADCTAGFGGALFTADGGASTALACTFMRNRAEEGALVLRPDGGAVASDGDSRTSLVNCTITDNSSAYGAGGICTHGTGSGTTLYVLSSIVTGNFDGEDRPLDITIGSKAKTVRTIYGVRTAGNLDATWDDTPTVAGGVTVTEVFTGVDADGTPVGLDVPMGGVVQTVYPARGGALIAGGYARFAKEDVRREAAVWCESPGAACKPLWGTAAAILKARSGEVFAVDQIGRTMEKATLGATVLTEKYFELLRPDGSVELFTSRDEAIDAANAAVTHEPWYTPIESGDTVSLVLNALAAPVIGAATDFGAADASTVSVWLETDTVKPNLLYGLGRSETPVGPFVVEDGAWVRADADGVLHEALTAPKIGPQGFYRVLVR